MSLSHIGAFNSNVKIMLNAESKDMYDLTDTAYSYMLRPRLPELTKFSGKSEAIPIKPQ